MCVSLYPPQQEVLDSGILYSGFNCVLQMPTGSGKTWLAEQAIRDCLEKRKKAIYISPLRTLATELFRKWSEEFPEHRVGVFTGEFGIPGKPYPVAYTEADMLIMTPERLDACTRHWRSYWSWIPEVDVVIVDEAHLLGDQNRGARLEGTISRFQRLNPFVRIICLSATLGNRQELSEWLFGVEYESRWRPIPLEWRYAYFRKASEKPNILLEEVQANVVGRGKSLVFVQSRRRAEELARFLQQHGVNADYHHAGLGFDKRQVVEQSFRHESLQVLVATATMEMGVNLPVRQVILYDTQFFDGEGFKHLPVNNVWQRVGRAGRPGFDETGYAVILAPTWKKNGLNYERGVFEPIQSGLADPRFLAEQIVVEVSAGLARSQQQLNRVFEASLASFQKRLPNVAKLVHEMCEAEMLAVTQDEKPGEHSLRPTKLGRIVSRHLLAPATVIMFKRALSSYQQLSFLDILLIVLSSPDCEPVIPVDFEELSLLEQHLGRERSFLLRKGASSTASLIGVSNRRFLSSIKMSLMLRWLTRSVDLNEAAEEFGCYPFEIRSIKEVADRLLLAFSATAKVIQEPEAEESDFMEEDMTPRLSDYAGALQKMILSGLDEEAVSLTIIKGLGPKIAHRLVAAGITDIETLAMSDVEEHSRITGVSKKRFSAWIEEAEGLCKSHSAFYFEELGQPIDINFTEWPEEIDPYRLRRAFELSVEHVEANWFRVTGGLDPHQVTAENASYQCDCPDFAKGNTCKHILAVRLKIKDRVIVQLARKIEKNAASGKGTNLFDLWYGTTPKRLAA